MSKLFKKERDVLDKLKIIELREEKSIMFEDWIKEKQTATDHDIEKDFQIPVDTLKKWRLDDNQDSPMHFRLGNKILYPRISFG